MKKHLSKLSLMMAVVSLAAVTSPVFAEHTNACKDDIAKFCSDVDAKDHKAIHTCLDQHKDEVSDPCKAKMAKKHGKKKSSDQSSSQSGNAPAAPAATPPAAQ